VSADLLSLFSARGLSPKRVTADEWAAPCPACGGKDRCRVWPADHDGRGGYWCRQCETNGDAIQFLRDYEGLSYQEACAQLGVAASSASSTLPKQPRRTDLPEPFEAAASTSPAEIWATKAGSFSVWAHQHLLNNQTQLAWLADRGLSLEAVKQFRLGWNPGEKGRSCLIRPRSVWGLPVLEGRSKDGKPANPKRTFWLPRGLVIPQLDPDGRVLRLRIRRPGADRKSFKEETKYYVVPGSAMDAMILGHTARAFVVVESELDALMLRHQAGDLAGVVSVMTSNVKKIEAGVHEALVRADCILVALDFDKAGAAGWPRWQSSFSRAKRWPCPQGKDPGEAFALGVNMRAWIVAGLPPSMQPGLFPTGQPGVGEREGNNAFSEPAQASPGPSELPEIAGIRWGEKVPGITWEETFADLWRGWPETFPGRDGYFELLGMMARWPVRGVRTRRQGGRPEDDGIGLDFDSRWDRANGALFRRFHDLFWRDDVHRAWLDLNYDGAPVKLVDY